ncbi:MAG: phage repressor protein [Enterocloster asparagiformis]|nr:phage repressor protein [Enterocloster asparagiformis]
MKTELWNGYPIRFVEITGEWWAVAKDVAKALGYRDAHNMIRNLDQKDKGTHFLSTPGGTQELLVITEFGIYDAVFSSHKPEAKAFKRWVFTVLKTLRHQSGIEGFQVFRMLDKEHQKEMMSKLNRRLKKPKRVDFIKANTIANKAVSIKHDYPKMVRKADMTPEMLVDRQELLEATVELMEIKDKYGLDLSVSEEVYKLATNQKDNKTA